MGGAAIPRGSPHAQKTPSKHHWLNQIHLNFTAVDLFKSFGVGIQPSIHIDEMNDLGLMLRGLVARGLKRWRCIFETRTASVFTNIGTCMAITPVFWDLDDR